MDVNRNGVPFTTLRPGPGEPTTTIKEGAKGDVDIRTVPGADGPRGRQDTRIHQDGAVESLVVKPKGESESGVAESWGMGIDANGQVSTNNNRVPAEGQIRLSQDGNLREVTDRREATMSSTARDSDPVEQLWANWREARRTGDTEAMNNAKTEFDIFISGMVDNVRMEGIKAFSNVVGGISLNTIECILSDDDDASLLDDGQIQNGLAQVLTAAPKGMSEHAYIGTDFMPESGIGQVPWRYTSELGHQAMRDGFDDGWVNLNSESELEEVDSLDEEEFPNEVKDALEG